MTLFKQREENNVKSSVDSNFYLSLCDYGSLPLLLSNYRPAIPQQWGSHYKCGYWHLCESEEIENVRGWVYLKRSGGIRCSLSAPVVHLSSVHWEGLIIMYSESFRGYRMRCDDTACCWGLQSVYNFLKETQSMAWCSKLSFQWSSGFDCTVLQI